jgi:hypothetical protein
MSRQLEGATKCSNVTIEAAAAALEWSKSLALARRYHHKPGSTSIIQEKQPGP